MHAKDIEKKTRAWNLTLLSVKSHFHTFLTPAGLCKAARGTYIAPKNMCVHVWKATFKTKKKGVLNISEVTA